MHSSHFSARSWRSAPPIAVVIVLVTLGVSAKASNTRDDNDLDMTVLSCEEALGKLEECCPGFDPETITCMDQTFDVTGCGVHQQGRRLPAYTRKESECIRETSCDELRKSVCKRAAAATERGGYRETTEDSSKVVDNNRRPAVCP